VERSLAAWPDLRVTVGDLRHLPYEDAFFDGIVSFGAIEHDVNGPEAALAEMRRVLRSGAVAYCTVPCMNVLRRCGLMALKDWVVCNPTIRRLAGRKQDVEFFEYVFTPAEYAAVLEQAGFELLRLVPMNPYCLDAKGPVRRWMIRQIHQRWPWCLNHMVAAICRKP
jgi:ubiquinone/menaquinone biosynthesis C-methylase UbiE